MAAVICKTLFLSFFLLLFIPADQEGDDDASLELVEQAVKKLEKLSRKPRDTVLRAIYVCNGEVKVARDYLVKGPKSERLKTFFFFFFFFFFF